MTRPTPGPWAVEHVDHFAGTRRYVKPESSTAPVAVVKGDPRSADVNEANAHLIAAAPDLRDALEDFLAVVDQSSGFAVDVDGDEAVVTLWQEEPAVFAARAALAKAQGEESA